MVNKLKTKIININTHIFLNRVIIFLLTDFSWCR